MGIGQSLALLLARADFNILIISNDQEANLETEKMLKSSNGDIEVETILSDFLSE